MELDPSVFSAGAIAPETTAFIEELEAKIASMKPIQDQVPQAIRDAREVGEGLFGEIVLSDLARDRLIAGPAGDLKLRFFVPDRVTGIYLHIHSGGWTLGAAHHRDPMLESLAREAEVAVVSVDYRLAPEHPYPAAPDDCEAAAQWLVAHADSEFGTERIVVGGESAGAHLSAVTLLRMRDQHSYSGFSGANLVYGAFDLTLTPSAANWGERNLVLSTPAIQWYTDNFVAPEIREDPDVSPLYADLRGMPSALFTVGTLDPLLDDTLFMAQRWVAAGNAAELAVYPGGVHAFDAFDTEMARTALERMRRFVAAAVAG